MYATSNQVSLALLLGGLTALLVSVNSYVGSKDRKRLRDLIYHDHNVTQNQQMKVLNVSRPVNADGEYLYLSGAWF